MHFFWKFPTHSVNDSIYDFELVFQEIPVRNSIVATSPNIPDLDQIQNKSNTRTSNTAITIILLLSLK